jgi:hypothetical protein
MSYTAILIVVALATVAAVGAIWLMRCLTSRETSLKELFVTLTFWGVVFGTYAALYRWSTPH